MLDWDKVRIFHAVAEAGSFTTAGRRLNSSQSAVSRQIRSLEESLNVSLFNRHARGLVLTQEGEELFRTADRVIKEIEQVQNRLIEAKDRPSGLLRIATTVSYGSMWLASHIKGFIRAYPEIDVQLHLSDNDVDLAQGEADVAIRFHPTEQADMIQRQLLPVRTHIYGSAEYLAEKGVPNQAEDLDAHDLIVYGYYAAWPIRDINWILKAGSTGYKRKPILQINNIYGVLQAIESGVGLAAVPDYLVGTNTSLKRVLPDLEGPNFHAYFVYPRELRGAKRVLAFRDYVISQVRTVAQDFRGDES